MANNFETEVLKHSYKFIDKIKTTTCHVHEYFGIEYFSYQKIDKNGNFICLTDRPELAHYCLENNFHVTSPYLRHPNTFHSGLIFNDQTIRSTTLPDLVKIAGTTYDMSNTVALIHKSQDESVEFVYLIGKPTNQVLHTLTWNHQILLDKYLAYFKLELKTSLIECHQEAISLPVHLPDNYHRSEPFPYQIPTTLQYKFLKAIGQQELVTKAGLLSVREKECLRMILQGKTAKESATDLSLSARTVEYYLENIKDKFGCTYKTDLFNYAQIFMELHLL